MSFYFLKLFFAKVSEHSERCRVYLFDSATYLFWSNALYFCPSLFDYLINSFFRDFVDITNWTYNDVRSDFTNLVDPVSSSVCEIVTVKKSSSLSTSLFFSKSFSSPTFAGGSSQVFYVFFFFSYFWIEMIESGDNKYPIMSPFSTIYL